MIFEVKIREEGNHLFLKYHDPKVIQIHFEPKETDLILVASSERRKYQLLFHRVNKCWYMRFLKGGTTFIGIQDGNFYDL